MSKRRRIGILGGSFNPIHTGHLLLAEQAKQQLGLEKVLFIPANLSPLKGTRALAKAHQRYRMAVLATKSNPGFAVSKIELTRGGRSYSFETMARLKQIFADCDLFFLVGSDFIKQRANWKNIEQLSLACRFIIGQRPGFTFKKLPKRMRRITINAVDISSTQIRQRIRKAQSIRYLVPEPVRKYILKNKLYLW